MFYLFILPVSWKVVDSFTMCFSFSLIPFSHSFLRPTATDRVKMSLSLRQLVLMVGLVSVLTAFITGQTDGYHTHRYTDMGALTWT